MAMTQPKPATNAYVGYHDLREYLDMLESKGRCIGSRPKSTSGRDRRHRRALAGAQGTGTAVREHQGLSGQGAGRQHHLDDRADGGRVQHRAGRGDDPPARRRRDEPPDRVGDSADRSVQGSRRRGTGRRHDRIVPTPRWHERDGGRYLGTTAGFVTRDPLGGQLNMGSYRVMIKDKTTVSMAGGLRGRKSSTGAGGGDHILDNEKAGKPTPSGDRAGHGPAAHARVGQSGRARRRPVDGIRGGRRLARRRHGAHAMRDERPSGARACRDDRRRRDGRRRTRTEEGRTANRPGSTARTRKRS